MNFENLLILVRAGPYRLGKFLIILTKMALNVEDALRILPPKLRAQAPSIVVSLSLSGDCADSASIFLPPGFSLAPDGSFRWGTDLFPLLSGDSQQHALGSQQQWWSSYGDSGSTAQVAKLSSHLCNVLDMRAQAASPSRLATLPLDDLPESNNLELDPNVEYYNTMRNERTVRREHQHLFDSDNGTVAAPDKNDESGVINTRKFGGDDFTRHGLEVVQPVRAVTESITNTLPRPRASETPLQAYFLPADGLPVPVGGRGQPPLTYFSKVNGWA